MQPPDVPQSQAGYSQPRKQVSSRPEASCALGMYLEGIHRLTSLLLLSRSLQSP